MSTKVNIEQEEQKIIQLFNNKNWVKIDEDNLLIRFSKPYRIKGISTIITIHKDMKSYEVYQLNEIGMTRNCVITLELHQLLHKLFELWGWFDE